MVEFRVKVFYVLYGFLLVGQSLKEFLFEMFIWVLILVLKVVSPFLRQEVKTLRKIK